MTQSFDAFGVPRACPDIDTLADLQAGVLDATTADEVRRHADACANCTELLAALDATVESLAAMPQVQIPADVARRIVAALAAEAGRISRGEADLYSRPAPTSPTAPATVHELGARRAQTGAVPAQTGPVPTQTGSVPAQGSAVASLDAHRAKRAGRGRVLLAAAAAAAVIGGGALAINQAGSGGDTNTQAGSSTSQDSGNADAAPKKDGSVQSFAEPKDVLDKGALDGDQVSSEVAGEMAQRTARLKCLSKITPRPAEAPEAVQAGTYKGTAAYAFIFPTDDPEIIQMIVVDAADCATQLTSKKGPRN